MTRMRNSGDEENWAYRLHLILTTSCVYDLSYRQFPSKFRSERLSPSVTASLH